MAYAAPKNDWVTTEGLTAAEVNLQADNVIYLKGKADAYDSHAGTTTTHKTSATIREEADTALVIECRTSDPSTPANGRIWLRTDL